MMRTDKEQAIKLRLSGKSYGEIQTALGGISKSTLSLWLSQMILSSGSRQKIEARTRRKSLAGLLRRNRNQTALAIKRARDARRDAAREIRNISERDLLLIGAILYWAEGYKRLIVRGGKERTGHPVSLTNSDPVLIITFLNFLQRTCNVPLEKIKLGLRIFEHLNEREVIRYWIKKTGIQEKNFLKTYVGISKSSMGKRPYNRLPYGVAQIIVNDTKLFHRIMGWIEGVKSFFENQLPR